MQALIEEEENPDEYLFLKTTDKRNSSSQSLEEVKKADESLETATTGNGTELDGDFIVKDDLEENGAANEAPLIEDDNTNHADNEDSLNLTIGEDEAKLLQVDDHDEKEANKVAPKAVEKVEPKAVERRVSQTTKVTKSGEDKKETANSKSSEQTKRDAEEVKKKPDDKAKGDEVQKVTSKDERLDTV